MTVRLLIAALCTVAGTAMGAACRQGPVGFVTSYSAASTATPVGGLALETIKATVKPLIQNKSTATKKESGSSKYMDPKHSVAKDNKQQSPKNPVDQPVGLVVNDDFENYCETTLYRNYLVDNVGSELPHVGYPSAAGMSSLDFLSHKEVAVHKELLAALSKQEENEKLQAALSMQQN